MDCKEVTDIMDLTKMKVPELKKELKVRGLSVSGNKNELTERLQAALKNKPEDTMSAESVDDLDEDLLNDDDDEHIDESECTLNDLDSPVEATAPPTVPKASKRKVSEPEAAPDPPKQPKKIVLTRNVPSVEEKTESESNNDEKAPEVAASLSDDKKVVKLSELSAKERLEMRAKKFGTPLGGDAKMVVRAERFGQNAKKQGPIPISTSAPPSVDVLKQRAQRFGVSVSTALTKLENQQRLDKRKERFGGAPSNGNSVVKDKAQHRLDRFKQPIK